MHHVFDTKCGNIFNAKCNYAKCNSFEITDEPGHKPFEYELCGGNIKRIFI